MSDKFQEFQPQKRPIRFKENLIFFLVVFFILALLSSCGITIPKPQVVTKVVSQPVQVDRSLLKCGSEPIYKDATVTAKKMITYTDSLSRWGRGCQRNLTAVGKAIDAHNEKIQEN